MSVAGIFAPLRATGYHGAGDFANTAQLIVVWINSSIGFRSPNTLGDNVVFAGSSTTPGVGVPMVLISGRLAAERLTGPDPAYRSLAWR